jgi:protein-tyrosine-phosphatase
MGVKRMKNVYSPMAKEIVNEKIKNGEVKVKNAAQKPKVEKPKAEKAKPAVEKEARIASREREKLDFSEAQIIAAVKAIGHPASSREISDKLGIKDPDQGRGYIRTRMAALVKSKEIVTSKPADAKSRCTFLYSVA